MSELHQPAHMVDTHQHLWIRSERAYDWIVPEYGPLYADFGPEDVAADVAAAGVTATVLVQAADTYEDTFYMLSVAKAVPVVKGVVGWVPFDRRAEAEAALDVYAGSPYLRGVRALTHTYADPRWILGEDVAASIDLLAPHELTLDYVSVTDEHLGALPELARRHPDLTIVLDHMAKPPIADTGWQPWADLFAAAAVEPNVRVKLSGLNTASAAGWTASDWQPYVDHAVATFGTKRMMLGSDWPVSTLAGDFQGVWLAQREVIAGLSTDEQDDVLYRTAAETYSLDLS